MRRHNSFFGCLCDLPLRFAAIFTVTAALAASAGAQHALYTASRQEAISAFGAVSKVYTDYNSKVVGFTLGGDFTRDYRFMTPSLEVRYTDSSGAPVGEDSFLGGAKLAKRFSRFHPYFEVLLGYGVIHFANRPGYTRDNSTVFDGGIGLDYELSRSFSVKADLQQQFWKVGTEANELEPVTANLGIVYTIPFGWGRGREFRR